MSSIIFTIHRETIAAEPQIHIIGGWKIIIQPAASRPDSFVESSIGSSRKSNEKGLPNMTPSVVQQTSYRQDDGPETLPPSPPIPDSEVQNGDNQLPEIVPNDSTFSQELPTPTQASPTVRFDIDSVGQLYTRIYNSIPFSRAEYDANPSYIHDSTMEILFGQMRPTVIHRGSTNVHHHYEDYGYGFWGYGNGYAYPPVQLVVPGTGLRIHRSL
ncbi:MAG: hypothetical protein FJ267_16640 [Planctomycetes bacterium]|nr:hypothetical protein [Planctomycetota bacterium]